MAKIIKTDTWHFWAFNKTLPDNRDDRAKRLRNLTTCGYWRTVLFAFPICVLLSPLLLIMWICEESRFAPRLQQWNKRVDDKIENIRFCEFAKFDKEIS